MILLDKGVNTIQKRKTSYCLGAQNAGKRTMPLMY